MKTHTEYLTIQTNQKREIRPITEDVKAALKKSEFTDGLVVAGALHANSAVVFGLNEPGFFQDLAALLESLAPERNDYKLARGFESNASTALQAVLVHPQVTVTFSEGRLDLGPWQEILYVEFDGNRPKRVVLKFLGD
ncbi:MAG TPA: secondary thiamine-phosphate synthase enzyme YjbQ [Candidatus Acidoferrales bacterium]|nr:secondary thiamine-phosphate synthase enzyme YjbQ [Candidatus Acidoferrales bacterium]